MCATFVSVFTVDKVGRRMLFLQGGAQLLICQIITAFAIGITFGTSGNPGEISKMYASFVVAVICVHVSGFAWSWGPLGWLIAGEISPLEVRSAAQSITVSANMIFTFFIAQVFKTMLCHLKFGTFIFFAGFVFNESFVIYKYLPETRGAD